SGPRPGWAATRVGRLPQSAALLGGSRVDGLVGVGAPGCLQSSVGACVGEAPGARPGTEHGHQGALGHRGETGRADGRGRLFRRPCVTRADIGRGGRHVTSHNEPAGPRPLRAVPNDGYTDWEAVYQDNAAWVY